jgi:flagellar hook assembly protein FlgD
LAGSTPFPSSFLKVFPNPLNPRATISFSLERPHQIRAAVYDLSGMLVRSLSNEFLPAGTHDLEWGGRDSLGRAVSSGTYLVRLETDCQVEVKKIQLVR